MAKNSLPVATTSAPVETKRMEAEEMKNRAKYALEDIERAEGHKRDKDLMKHVKKAAKDKMNSLKKIC